MKIHNSGGQHGEAHQSICREHEMSRVQDSRIRHLNDGLRKLFQRVQATYSNRNIQKAHRRDVVPLTLKRNKLSLPVNPHFLSSTEIFEAKESVSKLSAKWLMEKLSSERMPN
jgi:hypothetical protein